MHSTSGERCINRRLITQIKIIQHNVLHWTTERRNELSNYYNRENPEIILLNATGKMTERGIKIFNYNVYTRNIRNEDHAGIAIAVRKDLKHQIIDDFDDDLLAVRLETTKGPIIMFTHYSPPRRNYLPLGNMKKIFQKTDPVYFIGDLNANHEAFGYRTNNLKGRLIKDLINKNLVTHWGPEFSTLVRREGKPDIILSNKKAFLNMAIEKGKITTSDHLPVIVILSTKAISKKVEERRNYNKADGEKYKRLMEDKIIMEENNLPLENRQINKEVIDKAGENWMKILNEAAEESIPKTKTNYYIHPKESNYLKLLEQLYIQIMNYNNWTLEELAMIRQIQVATKEESIRLCNEKLNEKIYKLNDSYKDPAKFWKGVKNLMGGDTVKIPYLLDRNGGKIHGTKEKEERFRDIWSNIFKISDDENQEFDLLHDLYTDL